MFKFKRMKDFIVYQQIMVKQELVNNNNMVYWDIVVRRVKANTQEEAIGKFVIYTNDVVSIQKLTIICIELSMLKCIE